MPRKSKRTPAHPAIAAVTSQHAAFRAEQAQGVGACFESDLGHDEQAILRLPENPFVWCVSPHGTHLAHIGTPAACLVDTRSGWSRCGVATLISAVTSCYHAAALSEGWLQLYVWDGSTLRRHDTVESLSASSAALIRDRAMAYIAELRRPVSEDLALAQSWQSPYLQQKAERESQRLDDAARDVGSWGPQ